MKVFELPGVTVSINVGCGALCRPAHRPLAAADEGHLGRHDRHELDIGVEREGRHINDGARNLRGIHSGLDCDRAVRLRYAFLHSFRHFLSAISVDAFPMSI
jgi:hypothetical protein